MLVAVRETTANDTSHRLLTWAMPPLRFYNTLTHAIEEFKPLTPPVVRMYSCGPTVYDFAHIGNFRSFLFTDVLRRLLELVGYEVIHVMNITDVGHMTADDAEGGEDRMALAARRLSDAKKAGDAHAAAIEDPSDPYQIAEFYMNAFITDARKLRMKVADEFPKRMPRATQNVAEMIQLIVRLLETGHAYRGADGAIYYSVESFGEYGRLSGNTIEQLRGGAGGRVSDDTQAAKRHPADFLLWKPDETHIMKWSSPWGAGYPGWHIECSAMAMRHLGAETIDIHTGGEDNIFPHHECEIAQSCGVTGKPYFARYWLHGRHLRVEREKMSKSLKNFYTVSDVLNGEVTGREVYPGALRLELIKTHYRAGSNFTAQGLINSGRMVERLTKLQHAAAAAADGVRAEIDLTHPVLCGFVRALADDLNMSQALATVFEWLNSLGDGTGDPPETLAVLEEIDAVLAVLPQSRAIHAPVGGSVPADDQALLLGQQLDTARAARDFKTADAIRQRLLDAGYRVLTTKDGTKVEKPLA